MSYFNRWNDRPISNTESNLIKFIQNQEKAVEDGLFGTQTLSNMVRGYKNPPYPFGIKIYGAFILFSDNILPVHSLNKKTCNDFKNSISGTFQYKNVVSSHLMINGEWIRKSSTHDWLKQPETVIFVTKHGFVGSKRILQFSEIENPDLLHVVGGLGLNNYDPKIEGFIGPYSDVLRKTNHTALGHDGKSFVGAYCPNMNAIEVKRLMIDLLKCNHAIMLDGGHIASANIDEFTFNKNQLQNNLIQFI